MNTEFIEPIQLKANDPCVLVNGTTINVDFRIISEDNYLRLKKVFDLQPELLDCLQHILESENNIKHYLGFDSSLALALEKSKDAIQKALNLKTI